MEQYNPTSSTDTLYTGMLTDDRGKEQQAGVGQGVKGMQHKKGESSAEEAALQARLAEITRGHRPPPLDPAGPADKEVRGKSPPHSRRRPPCPTR